MVDDSHIKAFAIMIQLCKTNKLNKIFVTTLLKMMGRFPPGTGVKINAENSTRIRDGIVSDINPKDVDEPKIKILTKDDKDIKDPDGYVLTKESNMYFIESREKRKFSLVNYVIQHNGGEGDKIKYYWKPNKGLGNRFSEEIIWKQSQYSKTI